MISPIIHTRNGHSFVVASHVTRMYIHEYFFCNGHYFGVDALLSGEKDSVELNRFDTYEEAVEAIDKYSAYIERYWMSMGKQND